MFLLSLIIYKLLILFVRIGYYRITWRRAELTTSTTGAGELGNRGAASSSSPGLTAPTSDRRPLFESNDAVDSPLSDSERSVNPPVDSAPVLPTSLP